MLNSYVDLNYKRVARKRSKEGSEIIRMEVIAFELQHLHQILIEP